MKTLLLTNDDGFLSAGIRHLRDYLSRHYDVYTVAPDRERSAISMSLSINTPLRLNRIGEKEFTVDGTPADCIQIALREVMPHSPDFVVSGMNEGENLCEDVFFSGTVAGAYLGHLYGVPSMAVSLLENKNKNGSGLQFDYEAGARITGRVLEKLLPLENTDIVYNLNIPYGADVQSQLKVTSLGMKRYQPSIVRRTDPRGREYFWIGTGKPSSNGDEGSDLQAVADGHVSLSIIKYDLNDAEQLKQLTEVLDGT